MREKSWLRRFLIWTSARPFMRSSTIATMLILVGVIFLLAEFGNSTLGVAWLGLMICAVVFVVVGNLESYLRFHCVTRVEDCKLGAGRSGVALRVENGQVAASGPAVWGRGEDHSVYVVTWPSLEEGLGRMSQMKVETAFPFEDLTGGRLLPMSLKFAVSPSGFRPDEIYYLAVREGFLDLGARLYAWFRDLALDDSNVAAAVKGCEGKSGTQALFHLAHALATFVEERHPVVTPFAGVRLIESEPSVPVDVVSGEVTELD